MRIGEIARLAGVSTRAVRHYHHIGLLPEPPRLGNGYREYALRDAVLLVRVRRLTELGLSLDEVRDVLADDAGRELVEVLEELDEDLARQETEVRARRERLAELLERAREGRLPAEGPVSPELAALFADMARVSAGRAGPEPRMAALDRELLVLMDSSFTGEDGTRMVAAMRDAVASPEAMERAYDLYARLDELEGADADDPRVGPAASLLVELLPDEVAERVAGAGPGARGAGGGFEGAFLAEFSPAQAEVVRRALRLAAERVGPARDTGRAGEAGRRAEGTDRVPDAGRAGRAEGERAEDGR
ncbi:MerR family transcriptional regulator [Streptomyces somaliensis DSM 40738]|uniref:MerR family transcriptional regulator n=1 Tax=Streptomyces somaliensis (strain ATCC 33201 / DSM 40738 / JCM 12659 / KCTC 9044 / NCTC 11332 / NRRL B-12077 / IP 733) TaxID=1134445 RepID=A0AA44ID58_STRE0|nr:MerR family transcriptional regulator [Streptomyces somaliensis]MCQ0022528.1 MerR family transcriptional regulator [Streptomyces somaliensis DSM 40738]NKY14316.1 MerR family transcriptional regulator [Streptomyces somaliensis DSM 40738]